MKRLVYLLLLTNLLVIPSYAQQNTISIKKKTPTKKKTEINGLYYSHYIIENVETHNRGTAHAQVRHYAYFINKNEVFLFSSGLPPQKIIKKLKKKGIKMADELGRWSVSNNDIYLEVKTTNPKYATTFRYVAELVNNKIYLSYKAAYREKTALDFYLYKYDTSVDL